MSNTEVTVTLTLTEYAVVMGAIDKRLRELKTLDDASLALATAGTKLTQAFRDRDKT